MIRLVSYQPLQLGPRYTGGTGFCVLAMLLAACTADHFKLGLVIHATDITKLVIGQAGIVPSIYATAIMRIDPVAWR